jgi:hypothetical protein
MIQIPREVGKFTNFDPNEGESYALIVAPYRQFISSLPQEFLENSDLQVHSST